jgi:hypothetical protein
VQCSEVQKLARLLSTLKEARGDFERGWLLPTLKDEATAG